MAGGSRPGAPVLADHELRIVIGTADSITQGTYAHLTPDAGQQDYHRLAFHCPSEPAKVYAIEFDERGKLAGKRALGPTSAVPPAA